MPDDERIICVMNLLVYVNSFISVLFEFSNSFNGRLYADLAAAAATASAC